ncbi:type I polyketide synthase [Plantactinospora endophytica]|uniref:Carrier domain-containing protein n=1 Tax=Plantactinospora endophytica TaxID=673535 RepID=A0ABQ4EEJ2_9ACTN|nr:type I polyketide synthase [Plantactinospora endophytica]GIG93135.1 hypothetical protein Pen02_80710 [Plantactinospora endophytica]
MSNVDGRVAIVGYAARLPGADDADTFWRNLCAGRESVQQLDAETMVERGVPESMARRKGFRAVSATAGDLDRFDAEFFGFTQREAEICDPQFRLFLELSYTALEHSGHNPWQLPGRVAVLGGAALGTYREDHLFRNRSVRQAVGDASILVGTGPDYIAPLVSYKLGYGGPSVSLYTACSTSLVAVHLGVRSLRAGDCDVVVVGGVQVDLPIAGGYLYREGGMYSADGHVRPFAADASGTIFGNGGAIVVLKRYADAVADGDTIYAIVLGTAVNNDGSRRAGFTAPGVAGQVDLVRSALRDAAVDPRTIGMIEAHGTGTVLGDPIEVSALSEVYREHTADRGFCWLGSVKGNVGHLGAAAGAVALIKSVYALRTGTIPPTINCEVPNPALHLDEGPFRLATKLTGWDREQSVRRAAVSSFGIGGTNAHAVLEQAPALPWPEAEQDAWRVVALSARTPEALDEAGSRLGLALADGAGDGGLGAVAYTLQEGRPGFSQRRAVVARNAASAAEALRAPVGTGGLLVSGQATTQNPRVAMLFPGQGAQSPGMGAALYHVYPQWRDAVDECAVILEPLLGFDLRELLLARPHDADAALRLRETAVAQPALFVVQWAATRLWADLGVRPAAMLGHSVGELTAACVAGVFDLPDALRLIARRGTLMQSTQRGAMLALLLDAEAVRPMLPDDLDLAAANSPSACVVSGPAEAVAAFAAELDDLGIVATPLRTSHAFHSRLLDPVLDAFVAAFDGVELRPPAVPFVSDVTGDWISAGQATDPRYWAEQLRHEVRFDAGLATLRRAGHDLLLEVGPGKALSAFARQHMINAGERAVTVAAMSGRYDDVADLCLAAAHLWTNGVEPVWERLERSRVRRRVALPAYPLRRVRCWVEPDKGTDDEPDQELPRLNLYLPTWRQVPRVTGAPDAGQRWLLVGGGELAGAVAGFATAAGVDAVVATGNEWQVAPDSPPVDRVLVLDGLDLSTWRLGMPADARRAYGRMAELAQALIRYSPSRIEVVAVTDRTWSVNGEPSLPAGAAALGPLLTLPREQPATAVRQIDADATVPAHRLATSIVAEVFAGNPAERVALRGERRWVQSFTIAPDLTAQHEPPPLPPLRPGGLYVLTGGLGGLGLAVAEEFGRAAGAHTVLIGRSSVPDRSQWAGLLAEAGTARETRRRIEGIQRVEAAGGTVSTLTADAADPEQMAAALRLVRERFGDVHGVVHAAGVPGGQLLAVHDMAAADAVFRPKLDGAAVLAGLADDGQFAGADFVLLFSSIVSLSADYGHCDYAAANLFLDALATARADGDPRFMAVNWWGWRDVGMVSDSGGTVAFQRMQRVRGGVDRIPVEHVLLDAMTRDEPEVKEFDVRLRPEAHWVWSEHRIDDAGALPGTSLLEMVAAAGRHAWGVDTLQVADVLFIDPVFVATETTARLTFTPGADATWWQFAIAFGDGNDERVQCRGALHLGTTGSPDRVDLSAYRSGLTEVDPHLQDGVVQFGPHYGAVAGCWSDGARGLVELRLDEDLAADVADFALHPALLDRASYGVPAPQGHIYLPFSYRRVELRRPIPAHCWAVQIYRCDPDRPEFIEADITIVDGTGAVCVIVEGYTCRSVGDEQATAPTVGRRQDQPSTAVGDGTMVGTAEGQLLLRRILETWPGAQVVTTVGPLSRRLEIARRFDQAAIASANTAGSVTGGGSRPVGVPYAAPGTAAEVELTKLWADTLGVPEIGIDDDFFELGGSSLTVVYLASRIRDQLGVELSVADLFERSTIRGLAGVIDGVRDGSR